ncbi:mediator of RNA polymerase II transcription subunit 29-like [Gigantopelta aegis]|uniref:mediator of RNA polymerase II transcription subunit 29-like n=1 Tax=Gigantopelta aegis TaxID=1735272 RepID=UPI001B88E435|nr:mediator of RNA polymerase II transcription subunit 29-like [Gigantopelta aegis]
MAASQQGVPQQNPGPQPQQQPQITLDIDPVSKFKTVLLPRLKAYLATLFKNAGDAFAQNAQHDSGHKSFEEYQLKFEKSLEEFYAICDQIEMHLRLALETQNLALDSSKYTPLNVVIPKGDNPPPDSQPYPQYLQMIKFQVNCAREIHDLLHECARKLKDS